MSEVVVGLLAIVVGGVFCFRGYLAMRVVIPIWGALAGFLFGAALVASFTGDRFLGDLLGWLVAFAVAVVFAAIAYLYYEVAVSIGMAAIGFAIGTSTTVALGVSWSWVIVLVGVAVGAVLAVLAIVADLPMVLLTILTATAGASTMVAGLMLVVGTITTDDLESAVTPERLNDDWWWFVIYAALMLAGLVAQLRDTARRRSTLRAAWAESGGRELRNA